MSFAIFYFMLAIFFIFEFFVRILLSLNLILYVLLWVFIIGIIFGILYTLFSIILRFISYIVTQRKYFLRVVSIMIMLSSIIVLILFWSGTMMFSWELLNYSTVNKILFTLYIFSIFVISINTYSMSVIENE